MSRNSLKRYISLVSLLLAILFVAHSITVGETNTSEQATENPFIIELQKKIAGQEGKPAGEVFKNIQLFKNMPAGRLLGIMQIAFAGSLGVDCSHCHTPGEWEKEDKPAKETARKMLGMMGRINNDLKQTIGKGAINCTTCHRGQVKPALSIQTAK